ncbi:adenine deaminase C-terminal domain-containing protein [Alicyclobacillus sendaiensis]|uniref:adenine deaminase C-terminal domain-containing protein n=1 Tax=Alicyclobacillus sendaiensis TaxID=192387 RepID=UPI0026F44652|nr:adenine deaminase C-terminal domain-containing protein [Alicyclobacillus sendaiensis]
MQRIRSIDLDTYVELISTARGRVHADLYIEDANIINVYTGEIIPSNIAIKGKHIAYVGLSDRMVGPDTTVVDLKGYYICPGYIEPHSHPNQLYNPDSLARFALAHGTTTMINDNRFLYSTLNEDQFFGILNQMNTWPIKMLWWARLDGQVIEREQDGRFDRDNIHKLLTHPLVVQAGEFSAWPDLLKGDRKIAEVLNEVMNLGKRVEGHLPGVSLETLCSLSTAGITCDHEAINVREVLDRIRSGLWTTLRYSSLRPDLPALVRELASYTITTNRFMMTLDGSTPGFLQDGFTDFLLKVAIESGMPPVTAYQMVTINPATYYGMDGEIGGIAPGRLADLVVLKDITIPKPVAVMAEGKWVARDCKLLEHEQWEPIQWEIYGLIQMPLRGIGKLPRIEWSTLPILRMENPVITRLSNEGNPSDSIKVLFISRDGHHLVPALLENMASHLDGLATTYTLSQGLLTLGRDTYSMQQAIDRVLEIGGGIVLVENGSVIYELKLPIYGLMSTESVESLSKKVKRFEEIMHDRGYPHHEPIWSLFFLTSLNLPDIRLTPKGVVHVKTRKIIQAPMVL